MVTVNERLEEIKANRLVMRGNKGKFNLDLNLLAAIIIGLLVPELAALIALAWLVGWLQLELTPSAHTTLA